MGFFSNIVNSIKKSTRSRFNLNKNTNTIELLLDSKDENYFTLEFETMNVENLYDPSVQKASKIIASNEKLGTLYIETIRLQDRHIWDVSPGSGFSRFIQDQFKASELKYIDSFDSDFAKFTKYQLDYEKEFGVIWFNLNSIDVFIIDCKGKLFNDLLEIYNVKNKLLIIEDTTTEIPLAIDGSLTQMNIREHFISKENR